MTTESQSLFFERIKKNAGLTIWLGVVVLIVGLLAMGSPLVAGMSIAVLVGIMLIIGGIGHLIFSMQTGKGFFSILVGVLTIIAGIYMLANPAVALATLTVFLAAYMVVSGIFEILMAFQIKPIKGWGWVLFSGILSLVLGVMIWSQFPLSGAWAIGLLVGINLVFSGWSLIMIGIAARAMIKAGEESA